MQKTKKERFKEVASLRTNRILQDIKLLANCANKNNYDYTEEEVKQIFDAINKELRSVRALFTPKKGGGSYFSFTKKE